MASKEFQVAMLANAARAILEADHPLAMDAIFPEDGLQFGRKLSRSMQRLFLTRMFQDGLITELKKNGVTKWEVRDRNRLLEIAVGMPRHLPEDEEDQMPAYYSKEAEKQARCAVASRVLRRLMEAEKHPETSQTQPKSTLFVAKKGDKHQQKQVWDKTWQEPFLGRLVDEGVIAVNEVEGYVLYCVKSKAKLQGLIDSTTVPCLHTFLFPETPCPIDHTKPPPEVQAVLDEPAPSEVEIPTAPPSEHPIIMELKTEVKAEVEAILENLSAEDRKEVLLEAAAELEEKEPEESQEKEEITTLEALKTLTSLIDSQSGLIMTLSGGQRQATDAMKKVLYEIGHVHSKLDKLHEENDYLRGKINKQDESFDELLGIVQDMAKAINPEESTGSALRKRMNELEKMAVEHRNMLSESNKLLRTGLGEAAAAMVSQAAKVFVEKDRTEVMAKMASVEENVLESHSRTDKLISDMFELLAKVRADYTKNNRVPVILQRMEAISEELGTLQSALNGDPIKQADPGFKIVSPDLSGV